MTIVYIETNFLMSIATGRDPEAGQLLDESHPVRIVMPGVCYIEAMSALEQERKHYGDFERALKGRIEQSRRDLTSEHAVPLRGHLARALEEAGEHFNDFERRLFGALIKVSELTERIDPVPEIVRVSVEKPVIPRDLTDNLILHCILHHADRHSGEERVLLTGNTRDFGTEDAKTALGKSGIVKYFTEAKNVLGWLGSTSS